MVEVWTALLLYGGGWMDDLKLVAARGVRRLFGWEAVPDPSPSSNPSLGPDGARPGIDFSLLTSRILASLLLGVRAADPIRYIVVESMEVLRQDHLARLPGERGNQVER